MLTTSSVPARGGLAAISRAGQLGFSLVEMMVALVLGLIVSGAVIAFIGTLLRSNSETILSTRLTQELRSANEVIAREVRRASYIADPLAVMAEDDALEPYLVASGTNVDPDDCILFGYQNAPTSASPGAHEFRAIGRRVDGGRGEIVMLRATVAAGVVDPVNPLGCGDINDTTAEALTSPQFDVSGLAFEVNSPKVSIIVNGRYRFGGDTANPVTRTVRSSVFVRSQANPGT